MASVLALAVSAGCFAQTKAETKLYDKTLKKPSLTSFDKFLKKYPSSVYADDIRARKDTLLHISPYSGREAEDIIREALPAGAEFKAIPLRSDGVDRIYAVCIGADSLGLDRVRFYSVERVQGRRGKPDIWKLLGSYEAPAADAEGMSERHFVDSSYSFRIKGADWFGFSYLMSSADRSQQVYAEASYCPSSDAFDVVAFRGANSLESGSGEPYRITGRVEKSLLGGETQPQVRLMLSRIEKNPLLVAVPERDYLTDVAIEWWTGHNPDALTSASKLNFNILPSESSLVGDFASAKGKVNSSRYRAVIMDTRGYTVVVVYQKDSSDYVLAWAEPECRNKYRDRLLNSIELDGSTMTMYFYKGSRTFKYSVNLASKTIRR